MLLELSTNSKATFETIGIQGNIYGRGRAGVIHETVSGCGWCLIRWPAPGRGDSNRLHQVFGNVLINAMQFTQRDGRVTVTLLWVNSHL